MVSSCVMTFLCLSLPALLLSLPSPEAEARAQPDLIALDAGYVLPLLLAGAAFAKGYLFGNLKAVRSYRGHGPSGGYNRRIAAGEYIYPGQAAESYQYHYGY